MTLARDDLRRSFARMFAELDAHPDLTVERARFAPALAPAECDDLFARVTVPAGSPPFRPPPGMREFYTTFNGLDLAWTRTAQPRLPGGGPAAGYVRMLPLDEVLGDWFGRTYFSEDSADRFFHPIDFFVEEGCAGLHLAVPPGEEPGMFFQRAGERASPMDVSFSDYLDLLLRTRGVWYWQTALARVEEYVNPYVPVPVEAGNARRLLAELFDGPSDAL